MYINIKSISWYQSIRSEEFRAYKLHSYLWTWFLFNPFLFWVFFLNGPFPFFWLLFFWHLVLLSLQKDCLSFFSTCLRVRLHTRNIEPDRNRQSYKTNIFSEIKKIGMGYYDLCLFIIQKKIKRSQVEMSHSHLHKNIIILYDTHVFYDTFKYINYKIATL